jgi:hypothetical protein
LQALPLCIIASLLHFIFLSHVPLSRFFFFCLSSMFYNSSVDNWERHSDCCRINIWIIIEKDRESFCYSETKLVIMCQFLLSSGGCGMVCCGHLHRKLLHVHVFLSCGGDTTPQPPYFLNFTFLHQHFILSPQAFARNDCNYQRDETQQHVFLPFLLHNPSAIHVHIYPTIYRLAIIYVCIWIRYDF